MPFGEVALFPGEWRRDRRSKYLLGAFHDVPREEPEFLHFYGYAAEKTGQKQVFLLHGDDIFIASEGDVVDRRYRVVKIGTASVQVEDIPYHNTQTLPLRQ